jgi:hypothetical protein
MRYLEKDHRPKSDDPDYWDVWTGKSERKVNWEEITQDWQNTGHGKIETNEDEQGEADVFDLEAELSDYGDQLCHEQLDAQAAPAQETDTTTATSDEDDELPF